MSKHEFKGTNDNGQSEYEAIPIDIIAFLSNGCINSSSSYDYDQQTSRVHWTEKTDLYAEDQFYAQFGDIESDNFKVNTFIVENKLSIIQIKYSCGLVLCDLEQIRAETDETKPCYLADSCKTRYDNLLSNRTRRRRSNENSSVQPNIVVHKEGELIVKRSGNDTDQSSQNSTTEAPTSASTEAPTAAPTEALTPAPTEAITATNSTSNALQQAVASVALIFLVGIF